MNTQVEAATSGMADEANAAEGALGSVPERDTMPAPSATRLRKSRNRLAVDERRAQLLKLGQELFGTYNYDELSIDDIARAARISKGLLYHYFPSKRHYYVEVIRAGAVQLVEQTSGTEGHDPFERLTEGLDAYLDYVEEHAKSYGSLLRSGIGFDAEVSSIVESTRQVILNRLLTRVPVHTPRVRNALRGWIGFVEGAVLDWLDHGDVNREELRTLLLEAARQSLACVMTEAELPGYFSEALLRAAQDVPETASGTASLE